MRRMPRSYRSPHLRTALRVSTFPCRSERFSESQRSHADGASIGDTLMAGGRKAIAFKVMKNSVRIAELILAIVFASGIGA